MIPTALQWLYSPLTKVQHPNGCSDPSPPSELTPPHGPALQWLYSPLPMAQPSSGCIHPSPWPSPPVAVLTPPHGPALQWMYSPLPMVQPSSGCTYPSPRSSPPVAAAGDSVTGDTDDVEVAGVDARVSVAGAFTGRFDADVTLVDGRHLFLEVVEHHAGDVARLYSRTTRDWAL